MKTLIKTATIALCLTGMISTSFAVAPNFIETLSADSRPMEDKIRDGARHPVQTMEVLEVDEGMTALDIMAGGGWWTRVLAAAVGPSGQVFSQGLGSRNGPLVPEDIKAMDNVQTVEQLSDVEANSIDVAMAALIVHHNTAERSANFLNQLYTLMKPGGVVAIIDHIGDPDIDNSQLHRIPVSEVRSWLENSEFQIVSESDLMRNNADDHTHPSGGLEPILGRNSDRFMFVVRKPSM